MQKKGEADVGSQRGGASADGWLVLQCRPSGGGFLALESPLRFRKSLIGACSSIATGEAVAIAVNGRAFRMIVQLIPQVGVVLKVESAAGLSRWGGSASSVAALTGG